MSRIGKKPIVIPAGVKISRDNENIKAEGPKGVLSRAVPSDIGVNVENDAIVISRQSEDRNSRSLHGLTRTLIANMVTGVSTGFQRTLEISGVGYRAETSGNILKLFLGFSKPMEYEIPNGISVSVEKQVTIQISGIDKEFVGSIASQIRALRKPEPYKGKGIKYQGEKIKRKVGKSAGSK
jgi:large subunit ribosomal protein L6